jgi:pyrroloquinoline quinone (PQQ) biosynthesis protein C
MNHLVETFRTQEWANKKVYSQWLAQSYYYTSYSTRMLAFAAGWTNSSEQSFYRRSLVHISEEQGHDLVALNDLKQLGETIEKYPEFGSTRSMWESQFYKIQKDPSCLLGYILALEAFAVRSLKEFNSELLKNYPETATRFVKVHADDDPDHVEQAIEQIEKCTPDQKKNIMFNFEQTIAMYEFMLLDMKKKSH